MASCITPVFGNSTCPQVQLTVEQSSATATNATLSWKLEYVAHGYAASTSVAKAYTVSINGATVKTGTFVINGITNTVKIAEGSVVINKIASKQSIVFGCSMAFNLTWNGVYGATKSATGTIDVAAKASYKVTYNANGGTGAPAAQTKWHGTALKLSSIKPIRNGHIFKGWATTSTGTVAYAPGASYTTDAAVTLYAVWQASTFTVTYDANGGEGAPAAQTKNYGQALTLSTTKPTRTNYGFKGWGLTPYSTTVAYAPGGSYTDEVSITLYAIWEFGYVEPIIENLTVDRCDSSALLTDDGKNALVKFNWKTEKEVESVKIEWRLVGEVSYNLTNIPSTGTSGSISEVVGADSLAVTSNYDFRITVTETGGGSTVYTRTLNAVTYTMDFLAGGKGLAIGKAASREGLDIGFTTYFGGEAFDKFGTRINNGLTRYTGSGDKAIDPNTTLDELILTDKNTPGAGGFMYIRTIFYNSKSTTSNRVQIAHPYSGSANIYHRTFYNNAWGPWYYHAGVKA